MERFFFSGTPFLLKEYSVGILNQTVENRRILLENNMVQRWSDLEEEVSVANSTMERIVQNRERTPEKFLRSNSMQKEFLQAMVDTCLSVMRKNTVTGSFLILANDQVGGDDTVCQGIYFRDSDPEGTPPDYSDILLERGSSSFSHEKGFPLIPSGPRIFISGKAALRRGIISFTSPTKRQSFIRIRNSRIWLIGVSLSSWKEIPAATATA